MEDLYDLERFVLAQQSVYSLALAELRAGHKRGHWMWFVFPQLVGLGHSELAQRYGLTGLDEAQAYLRHPVLGPRLMECSRAVAAAPEGSVEEIVGYVDALKLRSSMTLFSLATADTDDQEARNAFSAVLERFFAGVPDPVTLAKLAA